MDSIIRPARMADAPALLNIYAPYVTGTAVTFEYTVPSLAAFERRIEKTLERYPYLAALEEGQIVGYAYASAFKERAAYGWAVETTVYLRQGVQGRGLGKKLYLALEEALMRQNVLNLNACIAYTPQDDARLSNASAAFHERMGYRKAGHFTQCGFKFGTWYDILWMEKHLGAHTATPAPFIPITELK